MKIEMKSLEKLLGEQYKGKVIISLINDNNIVTKSVIKDYIKDSKDCVIAGAFEVLSEYLSKYGKRNLNEIAEEFKIKYSDIN